MVFDTFLRLFWQIPNFLVLIILRLVDNIKVFFLHNFSKNVIVIKRHCLNKWLEHILKYLRKADKSWYDCSNCWETVLGHLSKALNAPKRHPMEEKSNKSQQCTINTGSFEHLSLSHKLCGKSNHWSQKQLVTMKTTRTCCTFLENNDREKSVKLPLKTMNKLTMTW